MTRAPLGPLSAERSDDCVRFPLKTYLLKNVGHGYECQSAETLMETKLNLSLSAQYRYSLRGTYYLTLILTHVVALPARPFLLQKI